MDYSVEGYLERQTTEELEAMLSFCLLNQDYAYAIVDVLLALKKRYMDPASERAKRVENLLLQHISTEYT